MVGIELSNVPIVGRGRDARRARAARVVRGGEPQVGSDRAGRRGRAPQAQRGAVDEQKALAAGPVAAAGEHGGRGRAVARDAGGAVGCGREGVLAHDGARSREGGGAGVEPAEAVVHDPRRAVDAPGLRHGPARRHAEALGVGAAGVVELARHAPPRRGEVEPVGAAFQGLHSVWHTGDAHVWSSPAAAPHVWRLAVKRVPGGGGAHGT